MDPANRDRLLGYWLAFDHPVVLWVTLALGVVLVGVYVGTRLCLASKRIDQATYQAVLTRWRSWVWLTVGILTPILLGALWVMLAVMVLSILCFREYARVTGLFREKSIAGIFILGVLMVTFAAFDHFDRLFFALTPFTCGVIAIVTLPQDRPKGYIQRVALGVLGFVLLGYSFGYLSYMGNAPNYRPILVLVLLAVMMNDVFAYCVGRSVGGPRLLPTTSPGKPISGAVGALVLTTLLVVGLGKIVFAGTPVDRLDRLVMFGMMISILGQLGRLILSSIKRDVEIKDTGTILPGHGGLLDRFDSLVLVPPAVYHFLSLLMGPLGGPAQRLITGGQ